MNRAIFLDRDGVLNKERGDYTWLPEHLEINKGVIEALKAFQKKGYLLIIITNQGGINKGLYRHKDVNLLYHLITKLLGEQGIVIHDMFYCPHHDSLTKCLCRKPLPLLLERAIARYNIDPAKSFFIGDNERDILAGKDVGVSSILVPSNSDLSLLIPQIP